MMHRLFLVLALGAMPVASAPQAPAGKAVLLTVNGAIGPATSDYIRRGLDTAAAAAANIVVLQLDTPGGLDLAMRDIIRAMIASPVPVAVYTAPAGARAASAGTYMLYAAHIAAMAPATNLGAATPVQLGGLPDFDAPKKPAGGTTDEPEREADPNEQAETPPPAASKEANPMTRKMVNDAAAYIRGLAEMRGRNAEWAERAVREAASLAAEEALDLNVIDIVAKDLPDLLRQAHGRRVAAAGAPHVLNTAGLQVETIEPDWRNELLAVITDPNIAYVLMLLGIYGLFFELANPGYVLPGVIGGISLLLALYALQVLPLNYAGLGLMLLGIAFMIGEAFMPSFGVLGIGGTVAFVIGSVILFDPQGGNLAVSLPLIAGFAILFGLFFLLMLRFFITSRRRPVVAGAEELMGATGRLEETPDGRLCLRLHGEQWQVRSTAPLCAGAAVRVAGRAGLILLVEPIQENAQC